VAGIAVVFAFCLSVKFYVDIANLYAWPLHQAHFVVAALAAIWNGKFMIFAVKVAPTPGLFLKGKKKMENSKSNDRMKVRKLDLIFTKKCETIF
jgi:hypothetical protein